MNFELNLKEVKKFHEWNTTHLKTMHDDKEPYSGAIGGRLSFHFTLTSLGSGVSVECGTCRNEGLSKAEYSCNITDYDSW